MIDPWNPDDAEGKTRQQDGEDSMRALAWAMLLVIVVAVIVVVVLVSR